MALHSEVAKVKQNLDLLREQYVRLQARYNELEQKHNKLLASSGGEGGSADGYVSRLIAMSNGLYDKPLYSDVILKLADRQLPGHRLILATRSSSWDHEDDRMSHTKELDLSHLSPNVAVAIIKWVYTNQVQLPQDEAFVMETLVGAEKYKLIELKEKCEQVLTAYVSVRNCLKLYQLSEEQHANQLKSYCLQVISNHWADLDTEDFAQLTAPLLYEMFKAHTKFPLHLAIQHNREDVVFLFLIEYNLQIPAKLSERDQDGQLPLNLALIQRHESICSTLVTHRCDLNVADSDGRTMLHLAIIRGDSFAASFLIKNGANTNQMINTTNETPLHLISSYSPSRGLSDMSSGGNSSWPSEHMAQVASLLLEYGANADAQDCFGNTAMHRAVQSKNEEVFNVLLNHDRLNLELRNNSRETALWPALLQLNQDYLVASDEELQNYENSFAARLIKRGSSVDATDPLDGNCLLHKAANMCREEVGVFLVRHEASPNLTNVNGEAPMHLSALNDLPQLVEELLLHGADPNSQTNLKTRPRSSSTASEPMAPMEYKAESSSPAQTRSQIGLSSLSRPLGLPPEIESVSNTLSALTGMAMTSSAEPIGYEPSGYTISKISTNPFGSEEDVQIQSPGVQEVHESMDRLPDIPTSTPRRVAELQQEAMIGQRRGSSNSLGEWSDTCTSEQFIDPPQVYDVEYDPGQRTALHLAIACQHIRVVDVLLKHKAASSGSGRLQIALNLDLRDGTEETAMGLALWTGQFDVARELLEAGADIEAPNSQQQTLLYLAVIREQPKACLFLIESGADYRKKTVDNESYLVLAIKHQLQPLVKCLCEKRVELGMPDTSGNVPLWVALRSKQENIASMLILHGCDANAWSPGPGGCVYSMLHKAIKLRDTLACTFLIKNGADINSPFRPGAEWKDTVEANFASPLHMACSIGLEAVVQCLVEHHADVNQKDSQGRTPIHVAISSKHPHCSALLMAHPTLDLAVKDRQGNTPFAAALAVKDSETGQAIVQRDPKAAEQFDSHGHNFMHKAVINEDVEAVVFLMSVRADINSKVQNPSLNTPLHLAVKKGTEIVVRHLLLAGAQVNAVDNHHKGVLHMAVGANSPAILSVLLEHGADADVCDEEGNTAMHVAMQLGQVHCVKVLIQESNVNLTALNNKGQNCLHVLAAHAQEGATAIFNYLMVATPQFPINANDADGNTALMHAYFSGNASLCDALIRNGGHPAAMNRQGVTIFNAPVATKQLLFRVLSQISVEPTWWEGTQCQNCQTKFSFSTRKHHCRHCGRLLCSKCTPHQMPVLKFELMKPVRLCEVCSDVLRLGQDGR